MDDKKNVDVAGIVDAIGKMSLVIGGIGQHAGEIAHARKALYDAYISEGFTEAQALFLISRDVMPGGN